MRSDRIKLGRRFIEVMSIGDLIEMKKASARPQDIEDVKALEEIASFSKGEAP
jgi:hypothetical protein